MIARIMIRSKNGNRIFFPFRREKLKSSNSYDKTMIRFSKCTTRKKWWYYELSKLMVMTLGYSSLEEYRMQFQCPDQRYL